MLKQRLKSNKLYVFLRHQKLIIEGVIYHFLNKRVRYDIRVMSIDKTIEYIGTNKVSVIRYGDGEITLMSGKNLAAGYQNYNSRLAEKMLDIWDSPRDDLLLCISDIFNGLKDYRLLSRAFYEKHLYEYGQIYKKHCPQNRVFGNTFMTRPYYLFKDKSQCQKRFEALRHLWDNREVLIVEGTLSRQGVGNDLFNNATNISRILCPSSNAYERIEQIECTIREYATKDMLILVGLGPTAKAVIYDLLQQGYWLIDIGHIDSEYEWFIRKAKGKQAIKNKHTAEQSDADVPLVLDDVVYQQQIIACIE